MAFKKQDKFIFEDVTINQNTSDVISVPLVIVKGTNKYQGFVPGFVMKDIVSENLEDCKQKLIEHTKNLIKTRIKNNQGFPFFPTNEEIKQDFKNVVLIKRMNVKVR